MIRLICKELAMDYDGKTHSSIKTFDVEFPEVEKYLSEKVGYADSGSRHIIGEEIIDHLPQEKGICTCPKVKGVISSFCEKCGKPIEYKTEPTKEVPDIRKIEELLEKYITYVSLYHDKECGRISEEQIIFKARFKDLAQEISALYRKEKV